MRTIIKLCLFVCLLLLLALSMFACSNRDVNVSLLLTDKNGLQIGDSVRYKGIQIGFVESFELLTAGEYQSAYFTAKLSLDGNKMKHLYREMDFRVERIKPFYSARQITVYDSNVARKTPVRPNDYVLGKTNAELLMAETMQLLEDVSRSMQPLRERFKDRVFEGVRNLVNQLNTTPADTANAVVKG
ncbi:MAG: MlaD family protein [Rhodothermales bacterium]